MQAWNYISGWTSFSLPKNIQKRLYKFLLRKVIGQFLQTELDLDNFDVGIMNGSVDLRDLDLNLEVKKPKKKRKLQQSTKKPWPFSLRP